jgi:hypothetical protein
MSGIAIGEKEDGAIAPVRIDEEGRLVTSAEGGPSATEETLERVADAAETLASAVDLDGTPAPGQPAIVVVDGDPAPTFAAAPDEGTELTSVYVAGTAPFTNDRFGNPYATFIEPSASEIATAAAAIERTVNGAWPPVSTPVGTPALSLVVATAAGWLAGFYVANTTAGQTYYARVYDLAAVPANGAPATDRKHIGFRVAPPIGASPGERSVAFTEPIRFEVGCVIVLESSADSANVTLGTGAGAHITAQFQVEE